MERYAVYAIENMYQGLHGLYDFAIVDGDEEDAEIQGSAMSYELITSYDCIFEDLEEEAGGDEELLEELIFEEICYEVYKINDSKEEIKKLSNRELEELFDEYGYDEFFEKFCEGVV